MLNKIITIEKIVAFEESPNVWVCHSSMHEQKHSFPDLEVLLGSHYPKHKLEFSTKEEFVHHLEVHRRLLEKQIRNFDEVIGILTT